MIALASIRIGAARDWAEALLTPVTVVVMLARAAEQAGRQGGRQVGGEAGGGGYRADGSRVVRVRSLGELAGLVKGT